ncbi:MAG: energy transducer TonB [Paramuribaculum sp.]|nr:energy transducer TonB [Paramuribaculum sp.]
MHSGLKKILTIFSIYILLAAIPGYSQFKRTVACKVSTSSGTTSLSAYLYEEVDEPPTFPGGDSEMIKYINTNRRYPAKAYADGIEGRVLCSFIVMPDGEIHNIEVIRGVEKTLNEEAVRLISEMPDWVPGKVEGEKVATLCILPIAFRK